MKIIKRIALVVLVLLVLGVGAAFLFLDSIVRTAIEKGGTTAAGTPTTLQKADASLFSGAFGLEGFAIANPTGFRNEPFFALKGARAAWQNGSLLSDNLVIDEFSLDGLEMNLERSAAGNNWDKILDNMKKLAGPASAPAPAEPEKSGPGKNITIKKLSIQHTKAALHISGMPVASLNGDWSVDVPQIAMENLRSNGSTAEIAGKITKAVVEAVVVAAAKSGNGVFPADALKDLESGVKNVAKGALQDVMQGKTDPKDALKSAEHGVKDLFGKKKP